MSPAERGLGDCARVAPMLGARDGELSAEEARSVELHLAACAGCRALAADLEAADGLFAEALLARAAKRDFAPFVDAVMERVGASTPLGLRQARPERSGWLSGLLAWARAHRAAAVAGTLAPTLAAAALIVYLSGSTPPIPLAGDVEVIAEGRAAMVLQTSDGPVVLLGDDETGT